MEAEFEGRAGEAARGTAEAVHAPRARRERTAIHPLVLEKIVPGSRSTATRGVAASATQHARQRVDL